MTAAQRAALASIALASYERLTRPGGSRIIRRLADEGWVQRTPGRGGNSGQSPVRASSFPKVNITPAGLAALGWDPPALLNEDRPDNEVTEAVVAFRAQAA